MKYIVFILSLCFSTAGADDICDVTLRNYAQWEIQSCEKQVLYDMYGPLRVSFDPQGHATPQNLPPHLINRWERLYELCMRDGCYFCDYDEGSCETGTCGLQNASCKPYMNSQGFPKCGSQCADYAFIATLP